MAELSVADLRQLIAATAEANKATAEAGQANAARISDINAVLDKLALSQQEIVRNTTKVDITLDRVIQANTALDCSVIDLKQSMELVASRLDIMEKARTTLSTPGTIDLDPGSLRPERRRQQHNHQGACTGEDRTSSRALVRGELTDTNPENYVVSDEDDEIAETENTYTPHHRSHSGPRLPRFIAGLKHDIRRAIALQNPGTIDLAYSLAQTQETLLVEDTTPSSNKYTQRDALRVKFKQHGQLPGFLGAPPEEKKAGDKPAVATVSKFDSLRAQRRARGECFECGEKYAPGHKCPAQIQLHVLEELLEALQIEHPTPVEDTDTTSESGAEDTDTEQMMKVSVQALSGTTSRRSMRLQGQVGNYTALILIDSGSTSNFISKTLADRLQQPVSQMPLSKVKVAGGGTIDCSEFLPGVTWFTQGHKFTTDLKILPLRSYDIILDHRSLVHLSDQKLTSEMQHKAFIKLMGLQYKLVYRKGKENSAADALSRLPADNALYAISLSRPKWLESITEGYAADEQAKALLQELSLSSPNKNGYSLQQGLIRYKDRLWLGNNTEAHQAILLSLHNSGIGGHSGFLATYQIIKELFAWPKMKEHVRQYVQQCTVCQQAKSENVRTPGLLSPLPIPTEAWNTISMDFVSGLPKSNKYDSILVIIDKYTNLQMYSSIVLFDTDGDTFRKYWSPGQGSLLLSALGNRKLHCVAVSLKHLLGGKQFLKKGGMLRHQTVGDVVNGTSGGPRSTRQGPRDNKPSPPTTQRHSTLSLPEYPQERCSLNVLSRLAPSLPP
ncbi:hypothetical protein QYE76_045875 [Lolium multiflorum]|uniref:Integrase zinc-binding domain-containing protein n=1 Tax=Lolium multiflorum TaxID=4521 RepID=A0AAD8TNT5_LOLMU|nr:hypothetical protein QYE76_045875 [Lolium multiflorum]